MWKIIDIENLFARINRSKIMRQLPDPAPLERKTQMTLRKLLAAFLAVVCVPPVWGGAMPLGSVTLSTESTVRDTKLTPGSTVYSGDVISVGGKGATRIALAAGAQAEILSNSSVEITKTGESVLMSLQQGQASFHTTAGSPFSAFVGDATMRPLNGQETSAVIQSLSETHAVVAVEKGALLLTMANEGKTYTLTEGQAADLTATDDPQQNGAPAPAGKTGSLGGLHYSKKALYWTLGIVGGGVAVTAYLLARREPKTAPTNLVVSPSSF